VGWLTDRGRILIKHGIPEKVQKTQTGEIWTYKSEAGLGQKVTFEFVDVSKKGELRLRRFEVSGPRTSGRSCRDDLDSLKAQLCALLGIPKFCAR
jgi:hypothetical protein